MRNKKEKHLKREKRVRSRIHSKEGSLRLSIYRSKKHIYAQIIDDEKGKTLVSAFDSEIGDKKAGKPEKKLSKSNNLPKELSGDKGYSKVDKSRLVGELLANKASKKKIKKVIFDRGGYKYQGRVMALAEGARKGGLLF